jgi:Ca2+-binding RTX toxin-like protein
MPTQTTHIWNTTGDPAIEYGGTLVTYTIAPDVLVGSSSNDGVFSDWGGSTLVNNGTILSGNALNSGVHFSGALTHITNNLGASVHGGFAGILIDGIAVVAVVTNHGNVTSSAGAGIFYGFDSSQVALSNDGDMYGKFGGIFGFSPGASITNSGFIHSDELGIILSTDAGATAITNTGTIKGLDAALMTQTGARIVLTNSGTMAGVINCNAVNANDVIVNSSKITGKVFLGSGNDSFTSLGGTSGTVFGEGGKDSFRSGSHTDAFAGGAQSDTITIAGKLGLGDAFSGGAGSDKLVVTGAASAVLAGFNAAASSVEVWQGNSKGLLGTTGANVFNFAGLTLKTGLPFVDAGAGNDTIIGSKFADDLRGGTGNDTLGGRPGNDVLTGSLGKDTQTGGLGADRFDFNALADTVKGANGDVVTDFSRVQGDKIDLIGIDANTTIGGDQAFSFIRAQAFHHLAGELRFAGHILGGDVNGDGHADFEIHVNLATMQKIDFFL